MKSFVVRLCNIGGILAILLVYNQVAFAREEEDAAAKAEADAVNEAAAEAWAAFYDAEEEEDDAGGYADGVYQGTAPGFGGDITVEVSVNDGRITEVSVVAADGEDEAYLAMAEGMIPYIIEGQSADVDTISGATFSSKGIRDAAAEAIEKARTE